MSNIARCCADTELRTASIGLHGGSELRQPLGIAIVGGLILSQILTLYTTPVIYIYVDRFGLWCRQLRTRARSSWQPGVQAGE